MPRIQHFLVLLVATLISGAVYAQAPEQRVALVIGNAAYKEAPLKNPFNDATDVAAALRQLGFAVILRTNANRRQMIEAMREFSGQIKRGGVGVFYYAGHGVQSRGRNYLLPVGATVQSEADLEFEAFDANMVLAQMDEAGNRVNIVVLDACRDNPFARSFRSTARGLAQMDGAKGTFLAYATSPGSTAADGEGRNGIYTKHFLASLKQTDTKLEDVFKRVRLEVAKETGNKQIPWDASSVLGDFYFRPPVAGSQPVRIASNTVVPTPTITAQISSVPGQSFKDCDECPEVVRIPAGTFLMGSKADPFLASPPGPDEQPQHAVSIQAFAMGKFEVTQEQWYAVMGTMPSKFKGRTLPVEQVSWEDAQAFVKKLSEKTGKKYRLPSESEWEYAARGGTTTQYSFGDNITLQQANVGGSETKPVGSYPANAFGLHDMHGNVWEWVEDCWNANYTGGPSDGSAWTTGNCGQRVLRGGSWGYLTVNARSANRSRFTVGLRNVLDGFRVARTN